MRKILRALHRDAGYLAVGLTFTYALSGLAVNHVADWDPNFKRYERVHELGPLAAPEDDARSADEVRARLGVRDPPREVYRAGDDQLEILFEHRTLHVTPRTGRVVDEGEQPRFLLRAANFLHLNRGKKAWTYVADAYAASLLFLAVSGLFMLPGRRGLLGRGGLLALVGVLVPVLYVTFS